MTLAPGSRLGPYEVVAPLGAGGMGEVYRARDTRLGREVAIKVLPAEVAGDVDRLRRFEQEAKAASALNHPNILTLYDFGRDGDTTYLVTELLEGESLRERLREGPLPLGKAIEIAVEVARGLAAAHAKGIVHRDLKPENLFVTRDRVVKILDFGLAKLILPEVGGIAEATTIPGPTATGMVMGTPGYMAPEQVRGERADARSDVFALGCVLYEMVAGHRAFGGASAAEAMSAILRDEPPPMAATGSSAAVLERIVRRCLEKRPDDRFQSARDLGFALEALRVPTDSGLAVDATRRPGVRFWRRAALGAAMLALAGVSAFRALGDRAPSSPEFRALTFRRGEILDARFAPDGATFVYSAAWEGRPSEIFVARLDSLEARPLGVPNSNLLAVSPAGVVALTVDTHLIVNRRLGTLAEMPLSGGAAPRALATGVGFADYRPATATMVVANRFNAFELPLGKPFLRAAGDLARPRFSPDGARLAYTETDPWSLDGSLMVASLDGRASALGTPWSSLSGVAWAPGGRQVWVSGRGEGRPPGLYALTLAGATRPIWRGPETLRLLDVDARGRALLARDEDRVQTFAWHAGDEREHELSWLDASRVAAMSSDGSAVLFGDHDGSTDGRSATYLRRLDGELPVRLSAGAPFDLSRDGRWALVEQGRFDAPKLVLVPTGPGEEKPVAVHGISVVDGKVLDADRGLLLAGLKGARDYEGLFVGGLEGGEPRPISPEPLHFRNALSNDGRWVFGMRRDDGSFFLYPTSPEGGPPRPLPGLHREDFAVSFTADDRGIYVTQFWTRPPWKIEIVDVATGARRLWKEIRPTDPSGLVDLESLTLAPDGSAYAYSVRRRYSTLYLAEGLR